jgi:hypothetical protein
MPPSDPRTVQRAAPAILMVVARDDLLENWVAQCSPGTILRANRGGNRAFLYLVQRDAQSTVQTNSARWCKISARAGPARYA